MKSDTTEMVLLGAAAAVIALVVAFSMMDDKGSKKRSAAEMVNDAVDEVEGAVEQLKDAVDEAEPLLKKVKILADKVEAKVPPGSKTAKAVNAAKSGLSRVSAGFSSAASLIPEDVKDDAKAKVTEGVKELGGRAFNYLREAAGKSLEQNKPKTGFFGSLFSPVKKTPLPPGVG